MKKSQLKEIQEIVDKTSSEICDQFCKFSGTGENGHCVWCQMHEDDCPLDKLLEVVDLK